MSAQCRCRPHLLHSPSPPLSADMAEWLHFSKSTDGRVLHHIRLPLLHLAIFVKHLLSHLHAPQQRRAHLSPPPESRHIWCLVDMHIWTSLQFLHRSLLQSRSNPALLHCLLHALCRCPLLPHDRGLQEKKSCCFNCPGHHEISYSPSSH